MTTRAEYEQVFNLYQSRARVFAERFGEQFCLPLDRDDLYAVGDLVLWETLLKQWDPARRQTFPAVLKSSIRDYLAIHPYWGQASLSTRVQRYVRKAAALGRSQEIAPGSEEFRALVSANITRNTLSINTIERTCQGNCVLYSLSEERVQQWVDCSWEQQWVSEELAEGDLRGRSLLSASHRGLNPVVFECLLYYLGLHGWYYRGEDQTVERGTIAIGKEMKISHQTARKYVEQGLGALETLLAT